MTQERLLETPEHVVAKIEEVLGISPAKLPERDLVQLIEDLCDTALTFDQEHRDGGPTELGKPSGETEGISAGLP